MRFSQIARIVALATLAAATACSQSSSSQTAQSSAAPVSTDTPAIVAQTATPPPNATLAVPATAGATATAPASETPASEAPASAEPAASAAPAQFTDLAGVFGAAQIQQLGQLGGLGASGGAFQPNKPALRREFVRWLFNTNNLIWAVDPTLLFHPAAPGEPTYFKDFKNTDPDWPVVQGLQDAGVAVGFPDKTFKADQPITREQALAIKSLVDCGGPGTNTNVGFAQAKMPPYKDMASISKSYFLTIANCRGWDQYQSEARVDNLGRTFGPVTVLRPQAQLRRSEAALMIYRIGKHGDSLSDQGSRGVDDVLANRPAP
ncbi:MAG: S-layer homology domain-containing protein [Candidatus Eremiobacteraeota bacterium]|nr:S-layer homology domain-containing protein [Candidatus Eremiobacteraeota bacterium]